MAFPAIYKDLYLTERSFKNAQEFLDAFYSYYSRETLMDYIGTGVARVIFRGVDDAQYETVPKAFRAGLDWSRFDFYAPPPRDLAGGDVAKAKFLFDHRQVELRAVVNFLRYADKLGIPTPLNFYHLGNELHKALQIEKGFSYDPTTRAPRMDHPFPGEEVREAFALAQHYGVPTRFLDWTERPEVAMFFAAAASWLDVLPDSAGYTGRKRMGRKRKIAVYGLGCNLVRKLNLSLVHATRHQNPRLRAQAGVFVLDPNCDCHFMDKGWWPSLEDRVKQLEENENHVPVRALVLPEAGLVKWSLAASESRQLATLLLDKEVALETMFPSLESAALAFSYRQKILPRSGS